MKVNFASISAIVKPSQLLTAMAFKKVLNRQHVTPPPHEPGILPRWLHRMGVNKIISSGMGQRAQQLFAQNQIEIVGALVDAPANLVSAYLNRAIQTGENVCDH
jgi:predicted Fe-Mo cluster-binding NifX family protein